MWHHVLQTIHDLTKEYNKLIKYQKEKLDSTLQSKTFSPSKEKNYLKIVDKILEQIKTLQLSPIRVGFRTSDLKKWVGGVKWLYLQFR